MADIQYYERVLKTKTPSSTLRTKLLLVVAYAAILVIWLIIVLAAGLSASLLMLIPLLALTVSLVTWKYTSIEYEYSFEAGVLTFSKIYGQAKRRAIFDADIKTLVSVTPYTERAASDTRADRMINALSLTDCENPYICVFEEHEQRRAIILDCDEMTLRIFKYFKPSIYISK